MPREGAVPETPTVAFACLLSCFVPAKSPFPAAQLLGEAHASSFCRDRIALEAPTVVSTILSIWSAEAVAMSFNYSAISEEQIGT